MKCDGCGVEITDVGLWEPTYCCSGYTCGCMGLPIDPLLCDDCLEKVFGKGVKTDV